MWLSEDSTLIGELSKSHISSFEVKVGVHYKLWLGVDLNKKGTRKYVISHIYMMVYKLVMAGIIVLILYD